MPSSLEGRKIHGWGKGRNVTSAGWQVTLCDPIWHMIPYGVPVAARHVANCYTPFTVHEQGGYQPQYAGGSSTAGKPPINSHTT